GVQVIEVAEELVEPVDRGQMLVAIAEVVLAELASGVAEVLEELRDRGILGLEAECRARHAHFGQAGADWRLPGDERGASRRAALLAIEVGEVRALFGDAVDVGGPVAHDAVVVAADVEPADVVAHDEQDVWLVSLCHAGPLNACSYLSTTCRDGVETGGMIASENPPIASSADAGSSTGRAVTIRRDRCGRACSRWRRARPAAAAARRSTSATEGSDSRRESGLPASCRLAGL